MSQKKRIKMYIKFIKIKGKSFSSYWSGEKLIIFQ